MPEFRRKSRIDAEPEEVFAWHERPGAFERLVPPWADIRVLHRAGGIQDGGVVVLEMRIGPLRRRWVARHDGYEAGRQFRDVQVQGPFARWEHRHRFEADGAGGCLLEDEVHYRLPFGALGQAAAGARVEHELDRAFSFRHERTRLDLQRHTEAAADRPWRVAVTGSHGLIGRELCAYLTAGGHEVHRIVRTAERGIDGEIAWLPRQGRIEAAKLEGMDMVVHLAGESIASGRWTASRKREILASRRDGTRLLASTLAGLEQPPSVFVSASAVGVYGDRPDEVLTEESARGPGFLADVVQAWEDAADPAREAGIRVVHPRIGMLLTPRGGALSKLLPLFRAGLGGSLGSGRQAMSWIAMEDLIGVLHFALRCEELEGPVNAVAPEAVTNTEFSETLGRVLDRPAFVSAPAQALELATGEMGRELLLGSARVAPRKLEAAGFRFAYSTLEDALRAELGLLEAE